MIFLWKYLDGYRFHAYHQVWRAWPCIKMLCWVNTRRSSKLSCFKVGWHFEVEYFAYLWPWWIWELYLVDSEDMAMMFTFWRRCGFCEFICLSNVSMVHLCSNSCWQFSCRDWNCRVKWWWSPWFELSETRFDCSKW